jgi:DNA end-binding protein Ku
MGRGLARPCGWLRFDGRARATTAGHGRIVVWGGHFGEIPDLTPAPELLRLAAHILDGKAGAFEAASFRDRYEEALLAHLKAKQAGLPPQPQQSFAVPRAVNLMEALRRSIAEEKKGPAASRKASAVPARKRA